MFADMQCLNEDEQNEDLLKTDKKIRRGLDARGRMVDKAIWGELEHKMPLIAGGIQFKYPPLVSERGSTILSSGHWAWYPSLAL